METPRPFFNRDRWTGLIAYPAGDGLAQWLTGEFNVTRLAAVALVGGLIYAYEIPKWFGFIDRRFHHSAARTAMAILYFNPLWIARHLIFIGMAVRPEVVLVWEECMSLVGQCLIVGAKSFLGAIVLSMIGNYVIQSVLSLRHRFLGSATFSGLMAVYYALSRIMFQ